MSAPFAKGMSEETGPGCSEDFTSAVGEALQDNAENRNKMRNIFFIPGNILLQINGGGKTAYDKLAISGRNRTAGGYAVIE